MSTMPPIFESKPIENGNRPRLRSGKDSLASLALTQGPPIPKRQKPIPYVLIPPLKYKGRPTKRLSINSRSQTSPPNRRPSAGVATPATAISGGTLLTSVIESEAHQQPALHDPGNSLGITRHHSVGSDIDIHVGAFAWVVMRG